MIRSGEAPAIGWSRNMLYSGFKTYLAPSFVGEPSSPLGYLRRYVAIELELENGTRTHNLWNH